MNRKTISLVVNDEGAIDLPAGFGYEQGFRSGAGIKLLPVRVNGQPFDPTKRRSPALHVDDEYFLITIGLVERLKIYPLEVEALGFRPLDEIVFELEEDDRSDDELEAANKEWRKLHGVPNLSDDEIARIVSESLEGDS